MKYLLILLTVLSMGCLEDQDATEVTTSTSTTNTMSLDISGKNNLVMVSSSSSSSASFSPSFAGSSGTCLTPGDVGNGSVASIVTSNFTACFKKLEKVDDTGGYAVWSEDTSNDSDKCGIINADGSVWETDKCPMKNGGFKNNKALTRMSSTILRGLSTDGDYIEYDQSNDTATVLIDETNAIDTIYEIQHTNKKQYMYKLGSTAKQMVDGISSIVPELGNKEFHPIGEVLQIKDTTNFKRGYFDGDGNAANSPIGQGPYAASPVPDAYAVWAQNGGTKPIGPTYHGMLNNCLLNKIGTTTIMNCGSGFFKYSDASADLESINPCALGNCGTSAESVSCSTDNHLFFFTPFRDSSNDISDFRLTRMDMVNETYSNIFDINDPSADMSAEQIANYHIQSIACSSDSVTAMTVTRTILINNADSTPDINYLDIQVEEVLN